MRLNSSIIDAPFRDWIADLEARHLAELTFAEAARALRALSSTYVQRRERIAAGAALSGAGKRAAFALFYGPLHFLIVRHVAGRLAFEPGSSIVDLGCGTGAAGAALATAGPDDRPAARVDGIDRNPWAVGEAARTYRHFGLKGRARQGDVGAWSVPARSAKAPAGRPATLLAAYTINELADEARDALMTRLLERARSHGDRILIVEPIAKSVARWWTRWAGEFERAGGSAAEWRFAAELPEIVAKLDRAAGLNHRELTARTICVRGQP